MKKVAFVMLLLLYITVGNAQNGKFQMLLGEWYYFEPARPEVQDTFRLSREKVQDEYTKWEFRENGSFYEQDRMGMHESGIAGDKMEIMISNTPSVWTYNKDTRILELKDLDRVYRLVEINSEYLVLLRLK